MAIVLGNDFEKAVEVYLKLDDDTYIAKQRGNGAYISEKKDNNALFTLEYDPTLQQFSIYCLEERIKSLKFVESVVLTSENNVSLESKEWATDSMYLCYDDLCYDGYRFEFFENKYITPKIRKVLFEFASPLKPLLK